MGGNRRAGLFATAALALLLVVLGVVSSSPVSIALKLALVSSGGQVTGTVIVLATLGVIGWFLVVGAIFGLMERHFSFSSGAEIALAVSYLGALGVGVVARKVLWFVRPEIFPPIEAQYWMIVPAFAIAVVAWKRGARQAGGAVATQETGQR